MTITTQWTALDFGKHECKTLPHIVLQDPDWFFWAVENAIFDDKPALREQAAEVHRKAQAIRIPPAYPGCVVEYYVQPQSGRMAHFSLVPLPQRIDARGRNVFKENHLDLGLPRTIAAGDAWGCGQILSSFRHYWWGSKSAVATAARCESFFSMPGNFV